MGLKNDRRMMVVTPEGRFLTQREYPKLALVTPTLIGRKLSLAAPGMNELKLDVQEKGPVRPVSIWKSDGVAAVDQGDLAAQWFSAWLGIAARLVHMAEGYKRSLDPEYAITPTDHTGFADGYPILLASEESLSDLNSKMEHPIPMDRFRPNLVVSGGDPFEEDEWKRIRIGESELAVVKPCGRCVVTTIDKQTLATSREPLRTLSTYRKRNGKVMFGQNAIPLNAGWLEVGMVIEIIS